MEKRIFEDHSACNRFMMMEGLNQHEATTQMSEYITGVKLKKLFNAFSKEEVENLFNKEMSDIAVKRHKEKLNKKLANLQKWQVFHAFAISAESHLESAQFVLAAKRSDKNPSIK
jgi:hypothetical protein